jgi:hypothetical protein
MSLLVNRRPEVVFDPKNRDHRKWVASFFRNNSWRECPVRFIVRENGNDINVIKRQLVEFYTAKEFKTN